MDNIGVPVWFRREDNGNTYVYATLGGITYKDFVWSGIGSHAEGFAMENNAENREKFEEHIKRCWEVVDK